MLKDLIEIKKLIKKDTNKNLSELKLTNITRDLSHEMRIIS
jgi:hypothetical protein